MLYSICSCLLSSLAFKCWTMTHVVLFWSLHLAFCSLLLLTLFVHYCIKVIAFDRVLVRWCLWHRLTLWLCTCNTLQSSCALASDNHFLERDEYFFKRTQRTGQVLFLIHKVMVTLQIIGNTLYKMIHAACQPLYNIISLKGYFIFRK